MFVTALLAAACAEQLGPGVGPDEDEDYIFPDGDPTDPFTDKAATPLPVKGSTQFSDEPTDDDVCDLLPADDGACTHACDPVALSGYIPPGTCVTFTCTLTDGSTYRTGGCNN